MRKTTMKISQDTLWALNLISSEKTIENGKKWTSDDVIRFLIDFYKKSSQNSLKSQKKGIYT